MIIQPVMPREIDLKDPYWYVVSDKNIEIFDKTRPKIFQLNS